MYSAAIIGGGPVGLMCALLFKERCPEKFEVTIFEKRTAYTRKQILLIDTYTLKHFIPVRLIKSLERYGCYVEQPRSDTQARCYESPDKKGKMSFAIRISILEKILCRYVKFLGVHIRRSEKYDLTIDSPLLDDFDVIIGASGKNDIVREYLHIPLKEKKVSDAAVLTWKPKRNKRISFSRQSGKKRRRSKPQDRYRMFRSQKENYYASVQLTPNEAKKLKTVDTVEDAIFMYPELEEIFDSMEKYYNLDFPDHETEITVFPITLYRTDEVSGYGRNDQFMFIIGDAALGVHFFSGTGVNSGFKMAASVVDALCSPDFENESIGVTLDKVEEDYDEYQDLAMEKSKQVVLKGKAIGKCNKMEISELRKRAKGYIGASKLPKRELCFVIANDLVQ